jgi:hypothetical protein
VRLFRFLVALWTEVAGREKCRRGEHETSWVGVGGEGVSPAVRYLEKRCKRCGVALGGDWEQETWPG